MTQVVELIKGLEAVLGNSYVLYLKTQTYHWNVEGANFSSSHALFEAQYTDLAQAIDVIAERIRALGSRVHGKFVAFDAVSIIEHAGDTSNGLDMLKQLLLDQHKMNEVLQTSIKISKQLDDDVTTDLLIERLAAHEKNAWMLSSSIR